MSLDSVKQRKDINFSPDNKIYTSHLRDMVRCRTISDEKFYNPKSFENFTNVLKKNYPLVWEKAEKIKNEGSTFLKIKGKSSNSPLVLMSHKDVVFEGKKKWKTSPYRGNVINGKMYSRGVFDCKGSLCTVFEAMESLIKDGYSFSKDIYILSTSTEEIGGNDAPNAVEYFKSQNIVPSLVIDEGGAVLSNPFPSKYKRFAMIGAVERSSAKIIFDFDSEKDAKKFKKELKNIRIGKYEITPEVKELLHRLAKYFKKPLGSVISFLDKHPKIAKTVLTNCGADARSFCGSLVYIQKVQKADLEKKYGKLSTPVRINISGNYYNKLTDLQWAIESRAKKYSHKIIHVDSREADTPTDINSVGCKFVSNVSKLIFDDIETLPYPVLGRTDARYFVGFADNVIRFIPIEISLLQMTKFHCPNENINVKALAKGVEFYREAIMQFCE